MRKKILVLVANPKGTSNLNLLPEVRDLQEALQRSVCRDYFAVEWRIAKHQNDLRRHILDVKPQIVHFCGHGTQQGLVLEDDSGTAKVALNEVLVDLLRLFSDRIECVLLNACYSSSLADDLVKHLNHVIGMNQAVFDDTAIAFTEGFYDALGAGESYQKAFEIGRSAMLQKSTTRGGGSRAVEVIDENSKSALSSLQEYLIPTLKVKPNPTKIQPWSIYEDSTVRLNQLSTVPLQMPPLPSYFVERSEPQDAVKAKLLSAEVQSGTLVVSAIYGLGGIGKSVLALKIAHDSEIQARFLDGILWATLGQKPDILPLLSGWIQALGDYNYRPTGIESASSHLRTLLHDKRVLIVVDDVWQPDHLEPFRVGNESSCVLVTTREAKITDASRYDLDVMNESQAIELVASKLSITFDATVRAQVAVFVKRVGYLPLALELAASQIEEGATWQELLDDLNEEASRLESFDVYASSENINEEQRRKYSLLACFNLSFKRLSAEQRCYFAWLGIIPEDVSLTEPMAEILWQASSRQTRKGLRGFKSKSLLSLGVPQSDGRPTYRVHDLVRDLAKRLLTSAIVPEQSHNLPGLGLTISEANSHFLERYRARTTDGQWHTLNDDGYIYENLTWHMEQAGEEDAIHQLLKACNESGRNGWYSACLAAGKLIVFVNDLEKAWRLTTQKYMQSPTENIAQLYWYALIRTSLNSLSSGISPKILGRLVSKKIWQPIQALAYVRRIEGTQQKANCLAEIACYVPSSLFSETFKEIQRIEKPDYRYNALSKLAQKFPTVWPDVLSAIEQMCELPLSYLYKNGAGQTDLIDDLKRVKGFPPASLALCEIARDLPFLYVDEAIDIAHQIDDLTARTVSISAFVQRRPSLLEEVLTTISDIQNDRFKDFILRTLEEHLPDSSLQRVLTVVHDFQNDESICSSLRVLAHSFPSLWSDVIQTVRCSKDDGLRLFYMLSLAMEENLTDLWPEILELLSQYEDDEITSGVITGIFAHLPKSLLSQSLDIVQQIEDRVFRFNAYVAIIKRCPEFLTKAVELAQLIEDEASRCSAVTQLVQYKPEFLTKAVELTRLIEDEASRRSAVTQLVQYKPELLSEALRLAKQEEKGLCRFLAIAELVRYEPQLFSEAIEALGLEIFTGTNLWFGIDMFSPYLSNSLWLELLDIAAAVAEYERDRVWDAISTDIPDALLPNVVEAISLIRDKFDWWSTLTAFHKRSGLDEILPEVLDAACDIQKDEYRKSMALRESGEIIPASLWPKLLTSVCHLHYDDSIWFVLTRSASDIPRPLWPRTFEVIDQCKHERIVARILRNIAPHIPDQCLPIAIEKARQIQSQEFQNIALYGLLLRLPNKVLESLTLAQRIENVEYRCMALREIASYMPELWPEVLSLTYQAYDERNYPRELGSLLPHLSSDLLIEASNLSRQLQDPHHRLTALREIASYMPELWPEVLSLTHQAYDERNYPRELDSLLPHLSSGLLMEASNLSRQMKNTNDRLTALSKIAPYMPELCQEVLDLKQEEENIEVREARLREALKRITPYLQKSLLPKALSIACQIKTKRDRSEVIKDIAAHVTESEWSEVLGIVSQVKDEKVLLDVLRELVPYLPNPWPSQILETIESIQSEELRSILLRHASTACAGRGLVKNNRNSQLHGEQSVLYFLYIGQVTLYAKASVG